MSEQELAKTAPREITCEQCREMLSEYVDREISAQEKAEVEHHLATCVKCVNESTRLAGLKNIVQNWEGVKGSSKFREAVMQQYVSESRMMSSKPFTEAAAIARAESQREVKDPPPPKANVLLIAVGILVLLGVLALLLYPMLAKTP
ncbi:MAG: zf-HC2 domain-containing protein [Planctomycetota bacterium]|nr:zf-HC2 domain-containing protein [Planctomycetota bacterium]